MELSKNQGFISLSAHFHQAASTFKIFRESDIDFVK
jgi:hypothetical protein